MAKSVKTRKPVASIGIIRRVNGEGTIYYQTRMGIYHREDGPAIEYLNGHKEWYIKGIHHRVGGPAIIQQDGTNYWMQGGKYHRDDGPAMTYANGAKQYYLNNVRYEEKDYLRALKERRMTKALESLEKFTDKFGKGDTLNKAGVAVMRFLQGECDHSFQTKDQTCELCDSQ